MTRVARQLALPAIALTLSACAATAQRGSVSAMLDENREGNYAAALEDADFSVSLGGASPDALHETFLLKGEALEGLGRKSEAIAIYQYLIVNFPTSGAAYQAQGRLKDLGVPCAR